MRRLRLGPFALILATAALTGVAALMLFSTFMTYDDEGYVLYSLKNFAEKGQLYHAVYSQYGPFPYAFWWALHFLGVPFTHHAERVFTVGIWAFAAASSGLLVWRWTREFAAALATLAGVFVYLWVMSREPSHPGGLIVLIVAILATSGSLWLEKDRTTAWAALTGAAAAALLLTKINVGGFVALAAVAVVLLHHRHATVRRLAPWGLMAGAAVLPWILMRALLSAPWVQTYALVFTLGAIPAIGAAAVGANARFGAREIRTGLIAGTLVAIGILLPVLLRGTTPAELLDGMLFGPLRHPVAFSLQFLWSAEVQVTAVISVLLFGVVFALRRRRPTQVAWAIAILRLGAAAAFTVQVFQFPRLSPDDQVFRWSASLLWPFLWPLPDEAPARTRARTWLGFLFLGQWLHAYPVPGSQIAWGSFLALPLGALGGWEAAHWLAPQLAGARKALTLAVRLTLVAGALVLGVRFANIGNRYWGSRSLDLPGAEMVRLPDSTTAKYRIMCINALAHTDRIFSLPGMFSFNLWTGVPAPTLANATHWFSLLSAAQQDEIIAALAAHPRAGIIVEKDHLEFLRKHGLAPHGRLYDVIMRDDYEPAFTIDGFEFRVRKGRSIAPFQTAQLLSGTDPAANPQASTLLQTTLLLPAATEIASVEITMLESRDKPLRVLAPGNCRIELTPINSAGAATGPTTPGSFPLKLNGPTFVNFYFNGTGVDFSLTKTLLVLRDAAGAELALVRLRP